MKWKNVARFSPTRLVVVSACLLAFGRLDSTEIFAYSPKILFLGNSITQHDPSPGIGWYGSWGMAASTEANDYVHRLTSSVGTYLGVSATEMDTNIYPFEIGDPYDVNTSLAAEMAYKPDILVMAIGENAEATLTSDAAKAAFRSRLTSLMTTFKNLDSHPKVFVRGCFWSDPNAEGVLTLAAADVGAPFVSLGTIGSDWSYMAGGEGRHLDNMGVATHPGDAGMLAISNFLMAEIQPRLAPTWTGAVSTAWSNANGLNNWKRSSGAAIDYVQGARVTFDDTATATTVDISAADVTPNGVTFNNSTKNFTVGGSKKIAGSTTLTKSGSGKVTLNTANTYTGLTTIQSGTLQLGLNAQAPVLGANGGGADIRGGKLVLDYTNGSTPAASVLSALSASYATGFASGRVRSSTATSAIGLGWLDNTTAHQVTIARALYGDADLSGSVDFSDLGLLLTNYNKAAGWGRGDFNYDGTVSFADLGFLLTNYNHSLSASSFDPASYTLDARAIEALSLAGVTMAPEPSALVLLGIGAMSLLAYISRRNATRKDW
jgi:autotransporter-associated beta strand protein